VNSLVGYSDSDWAGDVITRRSTSGYAIDLTYNPIHHKRTKHIRFHFIRQVVQEGQVVIDKVHTSDMLADLLTKIVTPQVLRSLLPHLMGYTSIAETVETLQHRP
jgi:hypothetical protein